jgi:hypothetical protein
LALNKCEKKSSMMTAIELFVGETRATGEKEGMTGSVGDF